MKGENKMQKPLETTKQEMLDAIEEMSKLTSVVDLKRVKINQQVGKLRLWAANLPKSRGKLNKQIAGILKERFEIGAFDNCLTSEQETIEEFIHLTLMEEVI